jgi:hypothetical protein
MAHSSKNWYRWNLRTLLLVIVPLCVALAYVSAEFRRVKRATDAWGLMVSKGVVSSRCALSFSVFHFPNGAVNDADLIAFIPACEAPLPNGLGAIQALELNGSTVSDEAIARFKLAAPACEVRR